MEQNNVDLDRDYTLSDLEKLEDLVYNIMMSHMDENGDYTELAEKYEKIIQQFVEKKSNTSEIKASTVKLIEKISKKNQQNFPKNISNNFIENIKSLIFVYDNRNLNEEIISRINIDTDEIRTEINRNNYNFVIESINLIIKNIISNM